MYNKSLQMCVVVLYLGSGSGNSGSECRSWVSLAQAVLFSWLAEKVRVRILRAFSFLFSFLVVLNRLVD